MDFPISEIEGIGERKAQALAGQNIFSLVDYIEHGIYWRELNKPLTGSQANIFESALLFLLPKINKHDVEVLRKNNVSIRRIDNLSVATIIDYFEQAIEKKWTKHLPTENTILGWQKQALMIQLNTIAVFSILGLKDSHQFADFELKINGKTHPLLSNGKFILSGTPAWSCMAKLYYQSQLIEQIDFSTTKQYALFNRYYSPERLMPSPKFVMYSPVIEVVEGQRIELQPRALSFFSNGSVFYGKKSGEHGVLLHSNYTVSGNNLVFNVYRDEALIVEDGIKYRLINQQFEQEA